VIQLFQMEGGGNYQIITFYIMIHSLFVFRYVPVVLDAIFKSPVVEINFLFLQLFLKK
jgi:hypothetical protein